jgi:hypothetical protein
LREALVFWDRHPSISLLNLPVRQKEQGGDEAQGIDETFVDAYVLSLLSAVVGVGAYSYLIIG